jgi:hypothetical protein
MAKIGVSLNIDVTKIDKAHIYEGKKGKYLTMTAFIDIDEQDQYGNNGMITQKLSKEAQDAGQKGAILGNSKLFWSDQPQPVAPSVPNFDEDNSDEDNSDSDFPF